MTWRMVVIMGGMLGLFATLDLFFLNLKTPPPNSRMPAWTRSTPRR
jgi:hypothetical protein